MTLLLNNTVLSNFSAVSRPDLVSLAFQGENVATVQAVLDEHNDGVTTGAIPECDWSWLPILKPDAAEQNNAQQLMQHLGRGEAMCITVAWMRGMRFATDDRDARRTAQRLGIPITGTLGILAILTRDGALTIAQADVLLNQMIDSGFFTSVRSVRDIR